MREKRVLNIVSIGFPFGNGEQFFDEEIKQLAKDFDEIVLFPLEKKGTLRKLPSNVRENSILADDTTPFAKKEIFSNLGRIFSIVGYEVFHSKKRLFILRKMKRWIVSICQSQKMGNLFYAQLDHAADNYFYSFWMNEGALMLAQLKSKDKIKAFNFRVNGFDIFDERNEGDYMPFRYYNYKHVNRIFVLSNPAYNYLKNIDFNKEKLLLSPYGIPDRGTNQLVDSPAIRIVSCSNVIQLKRLDKMVAALGLIKDLKIKWTHFGDGELLPRVKESCKVLPENIEVDFRGNVQYNEIIETYQNEPVNLFLHTSETEGLGMAIIEAQSFGVPAVVIGVGGVVDIVSAQTGVLLKPTAEAAEIANGIQTVIQSEMNTQAYRSIIKEQCFNRFNTTKNYTALGKQIMATNT